MSTSRSNGNNSAHRRRSQRTRTLIPQRNRLQQAEIPTIDEASIKDIAERNARASKEVVAEDDVCPICQLLLYNPVITRCNHTLCESCMAHWAEVSVTTQMTRVSIDDHQSETASVTELEARCPLCRTNTSARLDAQRIDDLKSKYCATYSVREEEETELRHKKEAVRGSIQPLTVCIGNGHKILPSESESSNVHEWNFFVKPSRTDIIEEVQILLHPTFRPNRVIRARPPYEIRRLGWGFFTITAFVILKAGYSWVSEDAEDSPDGASKGMLPLEWVLDFTSYEGRGSMSRCRLKVKNDRNWQDISEEEEEEAETWRRLVRQYERDGRYEPEED